MFKYLLAAALFICSTVHAETWQPIYTCNWAGDSLVIDRGTDNSSALQFVVHGTSAVNYIAASMKGNRVSLPGNVQVYNNGSTLVVSNLTAADVNPVQADFHKVRVNMLSHPDRAVLSWRSPADPDRREQWSFYGCQ